MPGDGSANCLLGIRGGAGMTGREVDGVATARVVSELDRTRQRLFIVQVRGTSGISGESYPSVIHTLGTKPRVPILLENSILFVYCPGSVTSDHGERRCTTTATPSH